MKLNVKTLGGVVAFRENVTQRLYHKDGTPVKLFAENALGLYLLRLARKL